MHPSLHVVDNFLPGRIEWFIIRLTTVSLMMVLYEK
jgi:hypothetical protein